MSDGINIEIVGHHKERYPAKIHSFAGENDLNVKFDDNPDVLCKVSINNVLLVSETIKSSKTSDYQVGCEVLVYQKIDDSIINLNQFNNVNLTHAWWPGKIEKLKGCFAAIQFSNKDKESASDIVELTTLRQMNDSRPLLKHDICVHEMLVPDDLCEFCERYDIGSDLHRWCGNAIVVNFDKINKKLQIFSTDKEVVRRASLLDASFMRVLRQKKLICMQKDELTKRLNDTIRTQYTEEFTVAEELMGLAIGSQGSNIKKAREIDGIINIELDDHTHTFVISAQTPEACKAARAQLEYMKKIFYVPTDIVSKVIGRNGNQIQDIIDQSGVMRVRVVEGPDLNHWADDGNRDMLVDHVPFIFVGSANSIRDACLLLEFSIDHHREMDRLQKERDDIHREIRNNQASVNLSHKFLNHSAGEREEDQCAEDGWRGHGARGRPRGMGGGGRGGYKYPAGDFEQHRNSDGGGGYGHPDGQRFRGRRGGGGFRQGSLPPAGLGGQHNGNRRYQQYEEDTEYEGSPKPHDAENGGRGAGQRYGGYRGGGGGRGRGRAPPSSRPPPPAPEDAPGSEEAAC